METTRTVVCKLTSTCTQIETIDATLAAFAQACNFAAETARRLGSINKVHVQRLEDLSGIRGRTRVRTAERSRQQSWSFFQLRQFIAYKAIDAGVPVVLVDSAYTSKTCHVCSGLGQRNALLFSCPTCGQFDADWNAELNITARGALVTAPELAG